MAPRVPKCVQFALSHLRQDAECHMADGSPGQRQRGRDLHDAAVWIERLIAQRAGLSSQGDR